MVMAAKKTELEKPWAFFSVQAQPQVKAFFAIAIVTKVGNGKTPLSGLIDGC